MYVSLSPADFFSCFDFHLAMHLGLVHLLSTTPSSPQPQQEGPPPCRKDDPQIVPPGVGVGIVSVIRVKAKSSVVGMVLSLL